MTGPAGYPAPGSTLQDGSRGPGLEPAGPVTPSTPVSTTPVSTTTVSTTAAPRLEATSLEGSSAFVRAAGLVLDRVGSDRVVGHLDLGPEHHTPWGIVHGGVYAAAIESAASIGASAAVRDRNEVAVGLTNTTHFLRSVASGRVTVDAVVLHQGRMQQLWQVDVNDGSGRRVAHGEVRLQNIAARS
jgi:1,4-dihydroxy-2-naphthoyl-CoA hydrolase